MIFTKFDLTITENAMQKIVEISDYEIERGKPMPSNIHSIIQSNLIFLLKSFYKKTYNIHSELTFEVNMERFTPDISLLPKQPIDFQHDIIVFPTPPITAIEILSPTQILGDLFIKMQKLIDLGTQS
ncbi:MAG: Uma2 family endonuclease, partial [Bacteroidota bacterium]|nr:Uma2 family endonuclease [Bacteroidota bacterium]